jgi:hypothetical protein
VAIKMLLLENDCVPNLSNSQNNWIIRRRHISGSEERKRDRGKKEGEKREGEKKRE